MTGFKSKKAAALDEDGMYLVHQTAQPAQEPVVWMGYDRGLKTFTAQQRIADAYPEIYTVPLYPSLPQRPWVDLTRTQIQNVYFAVLEEHRGVPQMQGQLAFGEALQAAIKDKNK